MPEVEHLPAGGRPPTSPTEDVTNLPRTVVLHDYVTQRGGAERVALLLAERFGGGALTTAAYLPSASHAGFSGLQVHELLGHVPERVKRSRATLAPLAAGAFLRHHVEAEAVRCSSSGWSHWTATSSPSLVYCYTLPGGSGPRGTISPGCRQPG